MSTKRAVLFAKDCRILSNQKNFSNHSGSGDGDGDNFGFKNWNNNFKNETSKDAQSSESKNISDNSRNNDNNALKDSVDVGNQNKTGDFWRKKNSLKAKNPYYLNYLLQDTYLKVQESPWLEDQLDNLKKSTLSLHIDAYENERKRYQNYFTYAADNIIEKAIRDPFGFHRQQKDVEEEPRVVEEIMGFKLTRPPTCVGLPLIYIEMEESAQKKLTNFIADQLCGSDKSRKQALDFIQRLEEENQNDKEEMEEERKRIETGQPPTEEELRKGQERMEYYRRICDEAGRREKEEMRLDLEELGWEEEEIEEHIELCFPKSDSFRQRNYFFQSEEEEQKEKEELLEAQMMALGFTKPKLNAFNGMKDKCKLISPTFSRAFSSSKQDTDLVVSGSDPSGYGESIKAGFLHTTPSLFKGFKPGRGTGDKGSSSLFNNERRWKDDEAFQALGSTDELSSILGICREYSSDDGLKDITEIITRIQCILQDLGSHIATPPRFSIKKQEKIKFDEKFVQYIDGLIDEFGDKTPAIRQFILPGGGRLASNLQYARTLCRRAERSLAPLLRDEEIDENALKFLNRLSDLLFVLGRYACLQTCNFELSYSPPLKKNNDIELKADIKATKLIEKKKEEN